MNIVKLKTKLFLLIMTPIIITTIILSTFFILSKHQDIVRDTKAHGFAIIKQIRFVIGHSDIFKDQRTANQLVGNIQQISGVKAVTIFNSSGINLFSSGDESIIDMPLPEKIKPNRIFIDDKVPGLYIIYSPLTKRTDEINGWVRVAISEGSHLINAYKNFDVMILIFACSIFFAIISVMLFQKYCLQNIKDISYLIKSSKNSPNTSKISFIGNDEIAQLGNDILSMLEALKANEKSLEKEIEQSSIELQSAVNILETKNIELDLARKKHNKLVI